jgi:hypothetical protein
MVAPRHETMDLSGADICGKVVGHQLVVDARRVAAGHPLVD